MNNWKIVCDKVSTTMDLSEMEFEKGVATLILSFLGWNEFRGNIKEQYHIEDHAKGYKPDFALFADSKEDPSIFVELKETGHKQRAKDVKQIKTYMMLTNCRFCIYFGEKMELFFIQIDGTRRSLKSVLTLEYNPQHPDGDTLLDLINYDTFDEKRLLGFCEDRLAADETAAFFTSEEGRKRLYELMAKDRQLSEGAAKLLPSMLSTPMRKEKGVETINDGDTTCTKPGITDTEKPIENGDVISEFKVYAEKTVGVNTTRNYLRHLKGNVSSFITKVIDPQADSVFSINSSAELKDCFKTLKENQEFVAFNKSQRYFLTASLSKYLEYLEDKEGKQVKVKKALQKPLRKKKVKKNNTERRPPFKFSMIDLKPGDEVIFDSRGWKVRVASDNTIEYKGEEMRMSTFCKKYLPDNKRNKDEAYQGPAFFSYHGKALAEIRDEIEEKRNEQE